MSKTGSKVVVAALAAMALFVAADAVAVPSPSNSGNPDITLVVWDPVAQVTYFRDLGVSWTPATVSSVLGQNLSFTADDNWSKFISALGGSLPSSTVYDVVSGYRLAGVNVLLTTAPASADLPNGQLPNNAGLNVSAARWDTFSSNNSSSATGAPNFNTGATPGTHGSNISIKNGLGEATSSPTQTWGWGFGQTDFLTYGSIGESLTFYTLSRGSSASSPATVTDLGFVWKLDASGKVTYAVAAIPEPESWMMLAGGLLALGMLAGRRSRRLR